MRLLLCGEHVFQCATSPPEAREHPAAHVSQLPLKQLPYLAIVNCRNDFAYLAPAFASTRASQVDGVAGSPCYGQRVCNACMLGCVRSGRVGGLHHDGDSHELVGCDNPVAP